MTRATSHQPALDFLQCRTPAAWVDAAVARLDLLLQDHATLELKAAQQAQTLIRRYGAGPAAAGTGDPPDAADRFRAQLLARMSRLAREELRHFEQVVEILEARGSGYRPVSASRYAAAMHALVRNDEPGRLVDTLLVGAIIEARSCERFASLVPALEAADAALASFYASLLRSEARHYQDYLSLAQQAQDSAPEAAAEGIGARLDALLARDAELIQSGDGELRFHSGVPPHR